MKKTLVLFACIAFSLGSFSIASANTIATQPIHNTPITTTTGHYIASWCLPISSSYNTSQLTYYASTSIKYQSYTVFFTEYTDSGCTTGSNLLGSQSAGIPSTTTVNVLDITSSIPLSGVAYMLVTISDNGTGGTMSEATWGTTGLATGLDYNNNAFILLLDQYGNTTVPDWADISVSPPINWSDLSIVSTSTSLFGDASSTLESIANDCAESGNIFSKALCRAFSYLFIPNPTVLNQFTAIGPTLETKFPVSWFYQVQTEIQSVATTTLSSPVWTMNLANIGIGSTTSMGNFLPNLTIFSSSTVKTYISESNWQLLMILAGASVWLGAFYTLYAVGHNLFTGRIKSL